MFTDLYSWLTVALTGLMVATLRVVRRQAAGAGTSRAARLAMRGVIVVLPALWILGHPLGAAALRAPLAAGFHSLATAREAGEARTVVVLAGGLMTFAAGPRSVDVLSPLTALRVLEGARVAELLGPDTLIIASGAGDLETQSRPEAEAMRDTLVALQVPRDRIVLESRSHNTRQQALEVAAILRQGQVTDFVLVTSGWHLRRAVGAFRAVGLHPIPSAAPDVSDRGQRRWQILPTMGSLRDSSYALREYLGLAYYGLRGWLAFGIS